MGKTNHINYEINVVAPLAPAKSRKRKLTRPILVDFIVLVGEEPRLKQEENAF